MPDDTPLTAQEAAATSGAPDAAAMESLLNEAQSAIASLDEPAAPLPPGVKPFELKNLFGATPANEQASMDLLRDVQLDLKIELGRTQMLLEDVLRMKQGAVVTLDKLAGDPVDIYANGRLIARGEVLVLNDNFCVRVAELIADDPA
jgi:flagellar motor switch protein FliN